MSIASWRGLSGRRVSFAALPLPERPILQPHRRRTPATAVGAFHIHTNRSDGSGSPKRGAAASRAGLHFMSDRSRRRNARPTTAIPIRRARHRRGRAQHARRHYLPSGCHKHLPAAREARDVAADLGASADSASPHIPTRPARTASGMTGMQNSMDSRLNADTRARRAPAQLARALCAIRFVRRKRSRHCSIGRT